MAPAIRFRPSRLIFFTLLLAGTSGALETKPAYAQDRGAFPLDKPRERRSGLIIGISTGPAFVAASGYPNSAVKTGDPRYYAASGVVVGSSSTFMIMGALADYLNFGFWFGGGSGENSDWKLTSGGGGVRVEVFPLFSVVPKLRDLGISGQFGVGAAEMKAKHGPSPGADGVQSFIATGAFYEFRIFDLWGTHFTLAPQVEYQAIFSEPFSQHGAAAGVRLALYGGP
ncbi:hypothetical protein [Pendulispora albinea]|uniref:Outer membrane protein beta-barrel domain-containing protein n=1 Tax=Pendulispora albinea TaxID=2741071 RepID=A0ABZ2LVT2_9BACT